MIMIQRKDPQTTARNLLRGLGISDLTGVSLEDLIQYNGVFLQTRSLSGAQGRIQFGKSYSLITIDENIKSVGQKRFVLAHEFGHHNLHFGLNPVFNCDEDSFSQWLQKGPQEKEANQFAAELLMPRKSLLAQTQNQSFSPELIKSLAGYFQTSLTATAFRLVEQGPYPMGLVYSTANQVRWSHFHPTFPLQRIISKTETPLNSAARQWFKARKTAKSKVMKAEEWFFADYRIETLKLSKVPLREYCLPLDNYDSIMSFLLLE
jgi:Zn-dependent peptidase ImmA (M78 family)